MSPIYVYFIVNIATDIIQLTQIIHIIIHVFMKCLDCLGGNSRFTKDVNINYYFLVFDSYLPT